MDQTKLDGSELINSTHPNVTSLIKIPLLYHVALNFELVLEIQRCWDVCVCVGGGGRGLIKLKQTHRNTIISFANIIHASLSLCFTMHHFFICNFTIFYLLLKDVMIQGIQKVSKLKKYIINFTNLVILCTFSFPMYIY